LQIDQNNGDKMAVFDGEASGYDNWFNTKLGRLVEKVETDLVLSFWEGENGLKVLDFGCGTGLYSFLLANLGHDVTAYDISEDMLAKAKEKFSDQKIEFVLGVGNKFPFDDITFDAVVSVTAFEFIEDVKMAVAEIHRVVRPGGKIVIGTINKNGEWGKMYMKDYFQENTVFKHAKFMGNEELQNLELGEFKEIKESLFFFSGHSGR
jgi:ubiquinone/menaquinone biosynthesis C-methylase UbiE